MKRLRLALIIVTFVFVTLQTGSKSAVGERASAAVSRLHLDGEICFVSSVDVENDGAGELAVGYVPDAGVWAGEKTLALYRSKDGRHYGPKPKTTIALPDDAGVVDFGDINNDGRPDIVFSMRGALWALLQGQDGGFGRIPVLILRYPYNLPYARHTIFRFRLLEDLNGDGRKDILLPDMNGYALFIQKDQGGFSSEPEGDFELNYASDVWKLFDNFDVQYRIFRHWVPRPNRIDTNGDGILDLAFGDGNLFHFFPFDPGCGCYRKARSVQIPLKIKPNSIMDSFVGDFDGNGFVDMMVMQVFPKRTTLTIEKFLYPGNAGANYSKGTALRMDQDKQIRPPMILDLDGDGKQELVTFTWKRSLNSIIEYFIRDRLTIHVAIYRVKEGVYDETPARTAKVSLKVEEEKGMPRADNGDFNGDGAMDLVYTPDSETLYFLLGNAREVLPERPSYEVAVPSYGNMYIEDINRDGRDDLAISYETEEGRGDFTVVISGENGA